MFINNIILRLNIWKKFLDYIEILISPGNHDASRKALPQPAIPEGYLTGIKGKNNIHSVGSPCLLSVHGVEVLMYHGRSLDDIIAVIPGMDHAHPEKSMKLLMQSRHLAPVYGGKTMLSPENRDYLVIDRVPRHLSCRAHPRFRLLNYRGVLVVNSGGWQATNGLYGKIRVGSYARKGSSGKPANIGNYRSIISLI